MKSQIYKIMEDSDYTIPIVLLTVLSSQNRRNKTSLHGYYMGCGIELMSIMCRMLEQRNYYIDTIPENEYNKLFIKLSTLINICLSQNVECIQKLVSKEKTLKMFHDSLKILNEKIFDIMDQNNITLGENIKKTDLLKYDFSKISKPKEKIMSLKQINKDDLLNHINKKYGSVCQASIIIGNLLGCGNENMKSLEKMGEYLGIMSKISNDFRNLERDLIASKEFSYNYIINFGIQESFELYMDAKTKIIEYCITLDLYSNTMKEVLDLIETRIDNLLGKTKADLKSNYTLSNMSTISSNSSIIMNNKL
jgi:hypothetical protein